MMRTSFPHRRLTSVPGHHWFGYYDKLETSPDDRFVLAMRTDFEGRPPTAEDTIEIGMVDTRQGDTWVRLGTSRAWCWQQGCMLQWVPGSADEVIWNDRDGDRFVARVLNVHSGAQRTLPRAVYTLSPDGRWAACLDFRRINDMRPGYGYAGLADPHADSLAPEATGIWRLDLASGASRLILSQAEVAAVPWPHGDATGAKHWLNHALISPDGTRIEFLDRWNCPCSGERRTRMMTVAADGGDLRIVTDRGFASHFIWDDPAHLLVCCNETGVPALCRIAWRDRVLSVFDTAHLPSPDGHVSLPPGHDGWLLTDSSSSRDAAGERAVYLHERHTGRIIELARFANGDDDRGPLRIDPHPRSTRNGMTVIIDAACDGLGRQLYAIELPAQGGFATTADAEAP